MRVVGRNWEAFSTRIRLFRVTIKETGKCGCIWKLPSQKWKGLDDPSFDFSGLVSVKVSAIVSGGVSDDVSFPETLSETFPETQSETVDETHD